MADTNNASNITDIAGQVQIDEQTVTHFLGGQPGEQSEQLKRSEQSERSLIPICKRFLRQRCTFGETCKFLHPSELTYENRNRIRISEENNDVNSNGNVNAVIGFGEIENVNENQIQIESERRCEYIIHNQRRCKMLALINEGNFCHYHKNLSNESSMTSSNREAETHISPVNKRVSASHKRMRNPGSLLKSPEPVVFESNGDANNINWRLVVDIGCARGVWLAELRNSEVELESHSHNSHIQTHSHTRSHYLGLELRSELAVQANNDVLHDNCVFFRAMNCKSEKHWQELMKLRLNQSGNYNEIFIAIQFPDPWAKSKHRRRRLVDEKFVRLLMKYFLVENNINEENENDEKNEDKENDRNRGENDKDKGNDDDAGEHEGKCNDVSANTDNVAKDFHCQPDSKVGNENCDIKPFENVNVKGKRLNFYISSDRHDLFDEMRSEIEKVFMQVIELRNEKLRKKIECTYEELNSHPLKIGTERDMVCEHLGRTPKRGIFKLKTVPDIIE